MTFGKLSKIYNLLERIDTNYHNYALLTEKPMPVMDIHKKYYPNIPEGDFMNIVSADPTSGEDKMGKYSKWLLWLYSNGKLKMEDLYKATDYLTIFHKFKDRIPNGNDIGMYQSLPQLYKAIQPFEGQKTHNEEIREIKEGAEKVYEDSTWLVVVPHTKEAAIYYGKNTKWCTAATNGNMFDDYNKQGKLYININKSTNQKYQFHFETQQLMDATDDYIQGPVKDTIGMTDGLLQYYFSTRGATALFYLTMEEPFGYKQLETTTPSFADEDTIYTFDGKGFVMETCPYDVKGHSYTAFGDTVVASRYLSLFGEGYKELINLYDTQTLSWAFPLYETLYVQLPQPYKLNLWNSSFLPVVFRDGPIKIFDIQNGRFTGDVQSNVTSIKPLGLFRQTKRYDKRLAVYVIGDDDWSSKQTFGILDMITCQKLTEPIYIKTFYEPLLLEREGYKFGEEHQFLCMKKPHNQHNIYNADYQNSDVLFYDGTIYSLPDFMQIAQQLYDKWLSNGGEKSSQT